MWDHWNMQPKSRKDMQSYRKVQGLNINIGDQVLLANKTERGKKKVADRWESTVHTIVDCKPDIHIYKIFSSNHRSGKGCSSKPVDVGEFPQSLPAVHFLCDKDEESLERDAVVSEHEETGYSKFTVGGLMMPADK
ncbi:hypothetical protein QTP86_021437, partial [Hemibagrus guttatus]